MQSIFLVRRVTGHRETRETTTLHESLKLFNDQSVRGLRVGMRVEVPRRPRTCDVSSVGRVTGHRETRETTT